MHRARVFDAFCRDVCERLLNRFNPTWMRGGMVSVENVFGMGSHVAIAGTAVPLRV